MRSPRARPGLAMTAALLLVAPVAAQAPERPFGTLREQADLQQQWLEKRITTLLPPLMRK